MKTVAGRKAAIRYAALLFIVALAGFTRWQAVHKLPVDFDEMVYLPAAFRYEEMLASGNWSKIIHYGENLEHPPLNKLLFAIDLLVKKPAEPDWNSLKIGRPIPPESKPAFTGPRLISAVGGTLQVLLLAIVHPIAGLLLALDTYHTKYSAQVYLEGLPGLMSILAVFLFERSLPRKEEQDPQQLKWRWLILSAISLGLATAGKYLYGIVGFVTLGFLIHRTRSFRVASEYLCISMFTFFAADPFLWPNPFGRLWESLTFHWHFSQSDHVVSSGMPWYSPFSHLLRSAPTRWHPGVFYTSIADWTILPLSIIGLRRAWRERPVWVAWAAAGLFFLLIWPTKWPQYILLVLPPLTVCAAIALQQIARIFLRKFHKPDASPSSADPV